MGDATAQVLSVLGEGLDASLIKALLGLENGNVERTIDRYFSMSAAEIDALRLAAQTSVAAATERHAVVGPHVAQVTPSLTTTTAAGLSAESSHPEKIQSLRTLFQGQPQGIPSDSELSEYLRRSHGDIQVAAELYFSSLEVEHSASLRKHALAGRPAAALKSLLAPKAPKRPASGEAGPSAPHRRSKREKRTNNETAVGVAPEALPTVSAKEIPHNELPFTQFRRRNGRLYASYGTELPSRGKPSYPLEFPLHLGCFRIPLTRAQGELLAKPWPWNIHWMQDGRMCVHRGDTLGGFLTCELDNHPYPEMELSAEQLEAAGLTESFRRNLRSNHKADLVQLHPEREAGKMGEQDKWVPGVLVVKVHLMEKATQSKQRSILDLFSKLLQVGGGLRIGPDCDNLLNLCDGDSGEEADNGENPFDVFKILEQAPPVDYPGARVPEGIASRAMYYQLQGLAWMMAREGTVVDRSKEKGRNILTLHPSWQQLVTASEDIIYLDRFSGEVSVDFRVASSGDTCGGLLCDEMGLGKTLEMLMLVLAHPPPPGWATGELVNVGSASEGKVQPIKATLIVVPASLLDQWQREIEVHVKPGRLRRHVYTGQFADETDGLRWQDYDLILTSYEVLRKDLTNKGSPLLKCGFWRIVLDEAQLVAQSNSAAARTACMLLRRHAWVVTGTPVSHKVAELHGLLDFLDAQPFADPVVWNRLVKGPFEARQPVGLQRLRLLLRHVMLRRTKEQVQSELELPPCTVEDRMVTLSPAEASFYETRHEEFVRAVEAVRRTAKARSLLDRLEGFDPANLAAKVGGRMLASFTRLRQTCCHPQIIRQGAQSLGRQRLTMAQIMSKLVERACAEHDAAARDWLLARVALASSTSVKGGYHRITASGRQMAQIAQGWPPAAGAAAPAGSGSSVETFQELLGEVRAEVAGAVGRYAEFAIRRAGKGEAGGGGGGGGGGSQDGVVQRALGKVPAGGEFADVDAEDDPEYDPEQDGTEAEAEAGSAEVQADERGEVRGEARREARTEARADDRQRYEVRQWLKLELAALQAFVRVLEGRQSAAESDVELKVAGGQLEQAYAALGQARNRLGMGAMEQATEYNHTTRGQKRKQEAVTGGGEECVDEGEAGLEKKATEETNFAKDVARLKRRKDRLRHQEVHMRSKMEAMAKGKGPANGAGAARNGAEASMPGGALALACGPARTDIQGPEQASDQTAVPNRGQQMAPEVRVSSRIAARREQDGEGSGGGEKDKKGAGVVAAGKAGEGDAGAAAALGVQDDTGVCPICLESCMDNSAVTSCGHYFCTSCIQEVILSSGSSDAPCPVCRTRLKASDVFEAVPEDAPQGVDLTGEYGAKVSALLSELLLLQQADPSAKSIIFSSWVRLLDLVGAALSANGLPFARLTGHTDKRQLAISRFNNDPDVRCMLMLMTNGGGAAGLTLTAASSAFILEPSLNPGLEAQAAARIHRLSQTKSTRVIRLIAENTIEERILLLQKRKLSTGTGGLRMEQLRGEELMELLHKGGKKGGLDDCIVGHLNE